MTRERVLESLVARLVEPWFERHVEVGVFPFVVTPAGENVGGGGFFAV